jgi:hypothetical protein
MDTSLAWAAQTFGEVKLGDRRLEKRLVSIAAAMHRRPQDTLPQQVPDWADTKAAYRFFANEKVSHAKLSEAHWAQTRQQAGEHEQVLMVMDITDINYSSMVATQGLGPVGRSSKSQGLMVHNTLAIVPSTRQVLGLADQQVWTRDAVKRKGREKKSERLAREDRQSKRWEHAVAAIGPAPTAHQWIYVGDGEADNFTLFEAVCQQGNDFVFRLGQNRRLAEWTPEEGRWVLDETRQLNAQLTYTLHIPAQRGQPARDAVLHVSWSTMTLRSPKAEKAQRTFSGTIIRARPPDPPAGASGLERVLFTTPPITDAAAVRQCIDWYSCRWIVEEYHSCLKTGCAVEKSQLRHRERLERRFALIAIVAVTLLQLRDVARQTPETPAHQCVEPLLIHLLVRRNPTLSLDLSIRQFWHEVAAIAGYLKRKRDPEPGWKSLWHGWLRLQDWAEGARLSQNLPSA